MIDILFQDADVLVVNKPGGLATQAPRQFDSLEARIRRYLLEQSEDDFEPYLGIPHRLDRCASGVMVFATRVKAARRLAKQFERRQVRKTYLALVEPTFTKDQGVFRDHLRKIPDQPQAEVVSAETAGGKLAVMHFIVEQRRAHVCCLRIRLETGRMHQIRLQLASRGFPILGDELYGSRRPFGPSTANPRERWIALHACEIGFQHPRSREDVVFRAPVPCYWHATGTR